MASYAAANSNVCGQVFFGTAAAGEPCKSSNDCAPVADADVNCGQAVGAGEQPGQKICVVPHGKQGDACNSTCTETGIGETCTNDGGIGGECMQ